MSMPEPASQWKGWSAVPFAIIGVSVIGIVALAYYLSSPPRPATPSGTTPGELAEVGLPRFASCTELNDALSQAQQRNNTGLDFAGSADRFGVSFTAPAMESSKSIADSDYSTTNVQVEGVDEADIVKTDGEYIYSISKNKLYIVQAGSRPELKSLISFEPGDNPRDMFIAQGYVLVIGNRSQWKPYPIPLEQQQWQGNTAPRQPSSIAPYPDYYPRTGQVTFVNLYSTRNAGYPELEREVEFDGQYLTARMIDDYAYLVMNQYTYGWNGNDTEPPLPLYRDSTDEFAREPSPVVGCTEVSYIAPVRQAQYLTIASIPMLRSQGPIEKEVVLGAGETVYASLKNLYAARTEYGNNNGGAFFEWGNSAREETGLNKFSLSRGRIRHVATGLVPGRLLNQFSMDEYDGNLRLATTVGHVSQGGAATDNRIYVLDPQLEELGVESNIAPGEQIYSARFMGKRGYLVTFKKVDPFFTLDLSDPYNPRVAGKLKIPGFSDYLHPYDETHIIGVGKETVEAEEGNFAWYQGMKMAIFDVSDFDHPRELHRIIIGDRGTDSEALRDHKAFLFSREKNLLILPIQLAEIDEYQKRDTNFQANTYGRHTFQGAFIYDISLDRGFTERGRISHYTSPDTFLKSGDYFYGGDANVRRALYIGQDLYTISDRKIKVNSLTSLSEKGEVILP